MRFPRLTRRRVDKLPTKATTILGRTTRYVDIGHGPPVVFFHGPPFSLQIWRRLMPKMEETSRCIASDLPGPSSDLNADALRSLSDWRMAIDASIETRIPTGRVAVVAHGLGSTLALDWCERHHDRVRGVAFTEAVVRVPSRSHPLPTRLVEILERARSSEDGEDYVVTTGRVVDDLLALSSYPGMNEKLHRDAFASVEMRRALRGYLSQVPLSGNPIDAVAAVTKYSKWLADTATPLLEIQATPGLITMESVSDSAMKVPLMAGHLVPEEAPEAMAGVLKRWLSELPAT